MANELGGRLRALRYARGLRRVDVARAADVTSTWLSRVERGHVPHPAPDVLLRLAEVFGVSLHELLTGEPEAPHVEEPLPSAERNRALVEDLVTEVVNHGNLAVAELVLAPTYTVHGSFPDVAVPRPFLIRALQRLRRAFPDVQVTLDDVIADERRVVVRWRLRGTHRGAVGEIAPTGKPVELAGMAIFGIQGGRVAEAWMSGDATDRALMQALRLLPPDRHDGAASGA